MFEKRTRQNKISASLVVFLVLIDQFSKLMALQYSAGSFINAEGIIGLFPASYFSFNLIIHWSVVLLLGLLWEFKDNFLNLLTFSLIFAGGVGNGLDKIFRHGVVDFIDIKIWPVFNLADLMISVGLILYFYRLVKNEA
jgi:signal peptidase II